MALDITTNNQQKRPIGFGIVGLVLVLFSGYLFYEHEQQKSDNIFVPSSYEYTVRQSASADVTYLDSSFYSNGPGPTNSAYVKDLTRTIKTSFRYNLVANSVADMTYTYDIRARVLGTHAIESNSDKVANVWSKEYQLVAPVTESLTGASLTVTPEAEVPYDQYKTLIESFKNALELPLNSEVVVEATFVVNGSIKGTPFSDKRVIEISAPLDQQVYTIAVKYDKEDKKQVVGETSRNNHEQFQRYLLIFAIVVGLIGAGMFLYSLRRQIFKTPYQRELEKIYRYNDGTIIRSQKPTDISGKRLVAVASFDDMLTIEEELKSPIVSSPAGPEATQFVIIKDDVAYVFLLGRLLVEDVDIDDIGKEIDITTDATKKRKRR